MAGRAPTRLPPVPRRRGPTPLLLLERRMSGLTPDDPGTYSVADLGGGVPPGWLPAPAVLPEMVRAGGPHLHVSPAVAGARMVGTLGYAVAGRVALALAVTGRAHSAGPDSLWLHLDGEGLVDGVGVTDPRIAVAAGDPLAGLPGVTVLPDVGAVAHWAADRIVATLDPLIGAVHELTRYGRQPMWNLVADTVLGPAERAARVAGHECGEGWAVGQDLLDALVARGAPIRRRGRLLPDGSDPAAVRGSCCLYYRQDGGRICATCPLERA